ncbi:unnamed protein product [Soboliphyme baturini]|uniref:MIF4G domain-containing protein n=1 Tax=Soboliphyme baturini TaxID=241478 RepID=A0A183IEQ0_9BILA|nr:unnamed protein product [Soboliphyme baturini]
MSEAVITEVLGGSVAASPGSDERSDGDASSSISPSPPQRRPRPLPPQPPQSFPSQQQQQLQRPLSGGTTTSDLSEEGDDVSDSTKTSDNALPSARESNSLGKQNKKTAKTPRPAMEIYRPPGNLQWKGENFQRNKLKQRSLTCCVTRSYFPKKQDRAPLPPPPSIIPGGDKQHGCKRQHSFVKDMSKKKEFSDEDAKEAKSLFSALEMDTDEDVTAWMEGKFEHKEVACSVGKKLVQAAVENGKNLKQVSKLSAILISCSSGADFHKSLLTSCREYFDFKEILRKEEFGKWLSFINFVSELYGSIGFSYEDEIVDIVMNIFNFLLLPPVLEEINIEELECVISALLNIGYDLERQCPDRLTNLRDIIRDALIQASEPWARKMILLLVELSASNWKLPNDANAYYFETQPCA